MCGLLASNRTPSLAGSWPLVTWPPSATAGFCPGNPCAAREPHATRRSARLEPVVHLLGVLLIHDPCKGAGPGHDVPGDLLYGLLEDITGPALLQFGELDRGVEAAPEEGLVRLQVLLQQIGAVADLTAAPAVGGPAEDVRADQ